MKYKFNPFSKKIIFLDTDFSTLDPYEGEILSIGLVRLNGDELYLEIDYKGPLDPWVVENIMPDLKGEKVTRKDALVRIKKFVGDQKPYIVAYVNQYDVIYTYKLFGKEEKPFHWLPIDFASILFGMGIDPESYYHKDKKNFFKKIGIDTSNYHEHNALDDARLLREIYLKMTGEK
jgi:DNA polymerase III epsilon subunit-like protein